MITIKELTIDIESGNKIINLIKKHEPEIWNVLKVELKEALNIPVVVKSLPQDNYCEVCKLPTDGEKCYSKRCPI